MKILFAYIPYMFLHAGFFDNGKKFDFKNLFDDPRGLTGSELSCFMIARSMMLKGHDVSILTRCIDDAEFNWGGIRIIPMNSINDIGVLGGDWDVVYSWNEIDALKFATSPRTLKMLNLQINDLNHGSPGFDEFIDVYTSPSYSHRSIIGSKSPNPLKWEVVPNGCDTTLYSPNKVIPGRVIYASSPDRGLHWLLQAWPTIKRASPNATLKIFYEISKWMNNLLDLNSQYPDMMELSTRARWINEALKRLKNHDVEVIGSISRNQIVKEFDEAQVLAYPCDTINYTEGFSVTLMEACASNTIPVTTDVDALGEIYRWYVPMVECPMSKSYDLWVDMVIDALNHKSHSDLPPLKLAKNHSWDKIANIVEDIIQKRKTI